MTELEWLGCTDPAWMLRFLGLKASNRKLRLFACACCRRIWQLMNEEAQKAVAIAETYADGKACDCALEAIRLGIDQAAREWAVAPSISGKGNPIWLGLRTYRAAMSATHPDAPIAAERAFLEARGAEGIDALTVQEPGAESIKQWLQDLTMPYARLVHDVFGSPFCTVTAEPTSRTPAVTGLAESIYDRRAFHRMPELAAALQNAGCTDPDILRHCREPGGHVRGCWVLDLLLGNE